MKVLHINTKDTGGAAIACIRLHHALLQIGVDSKLLTKKKSRDDIPAHYSFEEEFTPDLNRKAKLFIDRIKNKERKQREVAFLNSFDRSQGPFSFIESDNPVETLEIFREADIVHLHWVAKFINWETFFPACMHKKVVWTLHDMFPFTGGYHYAGGYEGYKRKDEDFPLIRKSTDPQLAQKTLARKKEILGKLDLNIAIVAPSQWLLKCSQKSSLFKNYAHYCIPYGIDTALYHSIDKLCCRKVLGLPLDKKVILFISQNVKVKRKGFHLLEESLSYFEDRDSLLLCSVGKSDAMTTASHHVAFGTVQEDRYLTIIYNAADVFVIPTLEDNLPNVVLESLSCGTPVIGFKVGGITDMVKPGSNGKIADELTSTSLYQTILTFLDEKSQYRKEEIRKDAVARYALPLQAEAYMRIYQ